VVVGVDVKDRYGRGGGLLADEARNISIYLRGENGVGQNGVGLCLFASSEQAATQALVLVLQPF
jgi:hypothetical protein